MVEFAFIVPLLIMLIFGIILFGLALNVKQDLTRAAAEGARAGAVALPNVDRVQIAFNATDQAVAGFHNGGCGSPDMLCTVSPIYDGTGVVLEAVEVTIEYSGSFAGNDMPFVGQVIPDTLRSRSVAQVNTE